MSRRVDPSLRREAEADAADVCPACGGAGATEPEGFCYVCEVDA